MNYTRTEVMHLDKSAINVHELSVCNAIRMLVSDVVSLQDEVKRARHVIEKTLVADPDRLELLKVRDRLRTIQENFDA